MKGRIRDRSLETFCLFLGSESSLGGCVEIVLLTKEKRIHPHHPLRYSFPIKPPHQTLLKKHQTRDYVWKSILYLNTLCQLRPAIPWGLVYFHSKIQNFSRFPVTLNLYTHAWSIKYRRKIKTNYTVWSKLTRQIFKSS